MVAGLVSSWRPPWFDTQMVVKPASRARTASSGLQIPLIALGPSHSLHSQTASSQLKAGYIWSLMKAARLVAGTCLLIRA